MLPISQVKTFPDFMRHLRSRLDSNYDICCVVTGTEGKGKSSTALQLAYALDSTFDVSRIGWNVDECITIAVNAPKGSAVLLDEAFDAAFNRQAMSNANKKWVKFLGTARARNLGVFICFPRYASLDPYIRLHRATHWVHVVERGLQKVYTPIEDERAADLQWKLRLALRSRDATYLPFWTQYEQHKMEYVTTQGMEQRSKKTVK
jgi:hypothetical protein